MNLNELIESMPNPDQLVLPKELEEYICYTTPNPTFSFVIGVTNDSLSCKSFLEIIPFIRNFQDHCLVLRGDDSLKTRLNCETIVYTDIQEKDSRNSIFQKTRLNNFFI